MGLIKEPKHVDFYVIDKPWTPDEKKAFSNLIAKMKARTGGKSSKRKRSKTKKAA